MEPSTVAGKLFDRTVGGLGAVQAATGIGYSVWESIHGNGTLAVVIVIAEVVVGVFTYVVVRFAGDLTERQLKLTGRISLIVILIAYTGSIALLGALPNVRILPWTVPIIGAWGILLVVQSSVIIKAGATGAARRLSPIEIILPLCVVFIGVALLGVAAAAASRGVVEMSAKNWSTASALYIEAVMIGALGVTLLIGRRAVVCLFILAVGVTEIGFGAASILGGDVFFGVAVILLSVMSLLTGVAFMTNGRLRKPIALFGSGLCAGLVAYASYLLHDRAIFSLAFLVLFVVLVGVGVIGALHAEEFDSFVHGDDDRVWPYRRYVLAAAAAYLLVVALGCWAVIGSRDLGHPALIAALWSMTLGVLCTGVALTIAGRTAKRDPGTMFTQIEEPR